jgi:Transglutaminase-like enzymes, putative cysteine proteases
MLFAIRHYIHYKYNNPVVLEPHFLRFRPREDPFQKLLRFGISIRPKPTDVSENVDLDGNITHQVWFDGLSKELQVNSTALVETGNSNPFNYLVYPETALRLPMRYPQEVEDLLKPYMTPTVDSVENSRFAEKVAAGVDRQTVTFLVHLTREISRKFQKQYRKLGEPYPPEKTLSERRGSCRDLVVLFMAACRTFGLATRFVSGYYFDELNEQEQYLHSWAEVYIPGGGWRGFDPSTGLATADRHIAVAASPIPRLSTPVTGTFLGNADAILTTDIKISAL